MDPSWSQAAGLFGKVSMLKNAITGGGASVRLTAGPCERGRAFEILINVQVDNADLDIGKVYLDFEVRESIESDEETQGAPRAMAAKTQTSRQQIQVAGEQRLTSGQNYDFRIKLRLPADAPLPQCGTQRHFVRAGIACTGNDPDTNWAELDVR